MTVPRPSIYPIWATDDVVDPISGQNNVTTPPPEKQTNGWDLKEFPPRQWFNWLGRYTYLWIQYLDQQGQQSVVNDGTGTNPTFNITTGGMAILFVIDTTVTANYYLGIGYIPPSPGSPVTLTTIASSTLTVSTVSITGVVSVSGGTGPYIMYGQMQNIP